MRNKSLFVIILVLYYLDSAGQNIGIGKPSPLFKLDVRGSINTDSFYRIGGHRILKTDGNANLFVGSGASDVNSGYWNTVAGNEAFALNTSGSYNTAIGYEALYHNITGQENTAVGMNALGFNTTGINNVALGKLALYGNYEGNRNTAIGMNAMANTGNSEFNTVVGFSAGDLYGMGWNNTIVGAEADVSFSNQYNSIVIGNAAKSTDVSKVRIGNSANWSYEAFANWTTISDGLYKNNVRENVVGLDFIMKLRPVTYQFDAISLSKKFNEDKGHGLNESMKKAVMEKNEMVWTGFIAQEVEEAAKQTNFNFSGVDKPRNEYGVYGLRYAEFVVPLVKGMQQQQVIIESLLKRIEVLEAILNKQPVTR